MSKKHHKSWRLWLAFYLAWTAVTSVWVYADAKRATQLLLNSNGVKSDHQIDACKTMNELATQEGQDRKLMELYLNVYRKNELDNVLEQMRAYGELEGYFIAERATGRHPHLEDGVHRILRDCASARVRIEELTRERDVAIVELVSYAGIVFLPPLVLLLIGLAFVWIPRQLKQPT